MRFALLATTIAASAQAQEPLAFRYKFTANQTLAYRAEQTTTVTETAPDETTKALVTTTTTTKVAVSKRWVVKAVDAAGNATLELTMTAMKQDTTQKVGDGKPVANTLDSAQPDDAQAMTFLNKPYLTVTLDPVGKLVTVKTELPGAADRLTADLPFKVQLQATPVAVKGTWERSFALKLPPPQGTGESFEAVQKATFRGMNGGVAVVGVATELKAPPGEKALAAAVAPFLWKGDVFFSPEKGTYLGARLSVKEETANHQGEGSKITYASEYTESVDDEK